MTVSLGVPSETSALGTELVTAMGSPAAHWVTPGNKPQNLMRALCSTMSSITAVIWRKTDWKSKNQEKWRPGGTAPAGHSWARCRSTSTFFPHKQRWVWCHTQPPGGQSWLWKGGTHLNTLSILPPPSSGSSLPTSLLKGYKIRTIWKEEEISSLQQGQKKTEGKWSPRVRKNWYQILPLSLYV